MRGSDQAQAIPLRVDVRNKEVWKGTTSIKLTRRAFEVLCYLVSHKGEVVTKDQLSRRVWHVDGIVVGDSALAYRRIVNLREQSCTGQS